MFLNNQLNCSCDCGCKDVCLTCKCCGGCDGK